MSFPKILVTQQGRSLLAKAFTGGKVEFTRFEIGSGTCGDEEDWEYLSGLINKVMEVDIAAYNREGDQVTFSGEFLSTAVNTAFWWRELAIFAKDVEDDESEIMCFYGNAAGYAEYVPAYGAEVSVVHRWDTTLVISSTADISAVISNTTYATSKQLNDHTSNVSNPHKVTKAQIGLSNVENVAPKDLSPGAFNTPATLTTLTANDTLGTMFGKVARLITNFLNHVAAYTNPHKVTWTQAGAPPANHRATGTNYGMANSNYYGHAKLYDGVDSAKGASDGLAATPKAVNAVFNRVTTLESRIRTGQVTIPAIGGTICYATVQFDKPFVNLPSIVATPMGMYGDYVYVSEFGSEYVTFGILSETDRDCCINWIAIG